LGFAAEAVTHDESSNVLRPKKIVLCELSFRLRIILCIETLQNKYCYGQ
jgi:hypothetical protein